MLFILDSIVLLLYHWCHILWKSSFCLPLLSSMNSLVTLLSQWNMCILTFELNCYARMAATFLSIQLGSSQEHISLISSSFSTILQSPSEVRT